MSELTNTSKEVAAADQRKLEAYKNNRIIPNYAKFQLEKNDRLN
jgi:hypothetical protein